MSVPPPAPRPPGRPNGVAPTSSYVAVVDVDPPIADHLLELLADAGISAVAEPIGGDGRRVIRPTDRVHVDRARDDEAHAIVAAALRTLQAELDAATDDPGEPDEPEPEGDLEDVDVDAEFARIVSAYGPAPEVPPVRPAPPSGLSARLVRRGDPAEEPDPSYWPDDHFVPPSPPRGPRLTRATRLAWLGAVGGPLLIITVMLLSLPFRQLWMMIGIGAFVVGFATLIARLPTERDDDDGAIV